MTDLIVPSTTALARARPAPALIRDAGERAERRYYEFFTAQIRNRNTRRTYGTAVKGFLDWCADKGIALADIEPIVVAAYIEGRCREVSAPTVKVNRAAIGMLFDWLVVGQIVPVNPVTSVKGPKHIVRRGKSPVLQAHEAAMLFDSIPVTTIGGLRDRALIGVMLFAGARVGAVCGMNVEDYYHIGRRGLFRFLEKGGLHRDLPAHHQAVELVDAYLQEAGFGPGERKTPLFRTMDRRRHLTERRMPPESSLSMVKRRARQAGLLPSLCNHSFRATAITEILKNDGKREDAQRIAGHISADTTALYDHSGDEIERADIERIKISLKRKDNGAGGEPDEADHRNL